MEKQIWVIDDVPQVRQALKTKIESEINAHVTTFSGIRAFEKKLKESSPDDLPQIIITDLFLYKSYRDYDDIIKKLKKSIKRLKKTIPGLTNLGIKIFVFSLFTNFLKPKDIKEINSDIEDIFIDPDNIFKKESLPDKIDFHSQVNLIVKKINEVI